MANHPPGGFCPSTPTPTPKGTKILDFSRNFAGLLGPKLVESGPGTAAGFFATFFCARRLAESPGDVF